MLGPLIAVRVAIDMAGIPRRPRNDRIATPRTHRETSLHPRPHPLPNLLMPPPILLIRHYYSTRTIIATLALAPNKSRTTTNRGGILLIARVSGGDSSKEADSRGNECRRRTVRRGKWTYRVVRESGHSRFAATRPEVGVYDHLEFAIATS